MGTVLTQQAKVNLHSFSGRLRDTNKGWS